MGARPAEYKKVAPDFSFIHVEEFSGPAELAQYLHQLDQDDEKYNRYFQASLPLQSCTRIWTVYYWTFYWQWKGTGEFINTRFFCRVCALLHYKKVPLLILLILKCNSLWLWLWPVARSEKRETDITRTSTSGGGDRAPAPTRAGGWWTSLTGRGTRSVSNYNAMKY